MTPVRTGIDRLVSGEANLARDGRIGLVTNRAARTREGEWTGDALSAAGCRITVIFTPEHGLNVRADAGAPVAHGRLGNLPILSLYGGDGAPVEQAMTGIDALVIDLPDVGCRYYTYPWTVWRVVQMAARHRLPVVILDRPNPLGGTVIEGNLPTGLLDSAVCASWVPVRHGLTMGELARWNCAYFDLEVELKVIPVEGWTRDMCWERTEVPWVAPSPALPSIYATRAYPGTCLLEGTNVSEGRGTEHPFQLVGAPFLDGPALATRLGEGEALAGAGVHPAAFIPTSSKWAGERCQGVKIEIDDPDRFQPVCAGLAIVAALCDTAGFSFRPSHFDALAGTPELRQGLERGVPVEEMIAGWREDQASFRERREKILLYS